MKRLHQLFCYGTLLIGLLLAYSLFSELGLSYEIIGAYTLATSVFGLMIFSFRKNLVSLSKGEWWLVGGVALVARLLVLPTDPILSSDIYRYIWEGYVANNGFDPSVLAPNHPMLSGLAKEFQFHSSINHPSAPTIYPLAMQLLFRLAAYVSLEVIFFKMFFTLFELLSVSVFVSILKNLGLSNFWAIILLWNPLLIIETAGNGHNDVAALLFLFLGFHFILKARHSGSLLVLCIGSTLKVLPIVAALSLVIRNLRHVRSVAIVFVTIAIVYLTAKGGGSYYTSHLRFNDGLFGILAGLFSNVGLMNHLTLTKVTLALTGITLFLARLLYSKRSPIPIMEDTYVMTAFFLCTTSQLHPWYLAWIIPFIAIFRCWEWLILAALVPLSYLAHLTYMLHGVWNDSVIIRFIEYAPFYLVMALRLKQNLSRVPVEFRATPNPLEQSL